MNVEAEVVENPGKLRRFGHGNIVMAVELPGLRPRDGLIALIRNESVLE